MLDSASVRRSDCVPAPPDLSGLWWISLRLEGKAIEPLALGEYPGETLRGAIGRAIRAASCPTRASDCRGCEETARCAYGLLYVTPPGHAAGMMRLYPTVPHPYVIEPETSSGLIPAGRSFAFRVILIGRASVFLPLFLSVFERLASEGLGRERGRYEAHGASLELPSGGSIPVSAAVEAHEIPEIARWKTERAEETLPAGISKGCRLDFLVPTAIRYGGEPVKRPEFHHLIGAAARRISALAYFHCGAKIEADFRALISSARAIAIDRADLEWRRGERFSKRQRRKMPMEGFVGTVFYAGDMRPFAGLLRACEALHIGRHCTFGQGRYRLAWLG